MHLSSLTDMVDSGLGDRVLIGSKRDGLTGSDLAALVRSAASGLGDCTALVYAAENNRLLPVAVLASAYAGVPFVPVNYRLDDQHLVELIEQQRGCRIVADTPTATRLRKHGLEVIELGEWRDSLATMPPRVEPAADEDATAIVLYTSGTTSAPKAALLRHRHLMAYLLQTVEYAGADENDAVLVSVPPYHIAGMANLLSNLFAGRRLVYLERFDAEEWLRVAREEAVTNAMVVPTMLAQIVEALDGGAEPPTTLRSLAYGGSPISERILARALESFPSTGFVNAYGLTETASTIALLGPDDHREALATDDERVRRRLLSAGRVLPSVEAQIRGEDGTVLGTDEVGVLHVRGEQVAGEYADGSHLDEHGWFCTRDRASIDPDGYLYLAGRADDVIIRGGENIAPAEIEEVLGRHSAIREACVVGVPDDEWGQRVCAVVVLNPGAAATETVLRDFVRERLRSSKTPDHFVTRESLPRTSTGKLLRRLVHEEMSADATLFDALPGRDAG